MAEDLYVGPVDNNELRPGTVCTVIKGEPIASRKIPKTTVVELTDYQQRVNIRTINRKENARLIPPIDQQMNLEWNGSALNNASLGFQRTLTIRDIKRVGRYSAENVDIESTHLTSSLILRSTTAIPPTAASFNTLLFSVVRDLDRHSSGSCPFGVTGILFPKEMTDLHRSTYAFRYPGLGSMMFSDGLEDSSNTIAHDAAIPTELAGRLAVYDYVATEYRNFFNSPSGTPAQPNYLPATRSIAGHTISMDKKNYFKGVSMLLDWILANHGAAFQNAVFEGWTPVHEVFTAFSKSDPSKIIETLVVDDPRTISRFSYEGGRPEITASLDHLPRGAMTSTGQYKNFVRLMTGKENTTLPPAPVNESGVNLWIGYRAVKFDPDVTIEQLGDELSKNTVIQTLVEILVRTLPSTARPKLVFANPYYEINDEIATGARFGRIKSLVDRREDAYLNTGANDEGIRAGFTVANDTQFIHTKRPEDCLKRRHEAAGEYFIECVKAWCTRPKVQDEDCVLRIIEIVKPLFRDYIQGAKLCHMKIELQMSHHKPESDAQWHKVCRFTGTTTDRLSKNDAKRLCDGDWPELRVEGW